MASLCLEHRFLSTAVSLIPLTSYAALVLVYDPVSSSRPWNLMAGSLSHVHALEWSSLPIASP
ncbi:uncharacterized protein H6S33_008151 [Morchella sextelata]|uniref:uncharacterized protein n=1 Tax=Morchella sextelata TaxID=1174677 RepID=UPI001D04D47E|nr:uncharacterized protein H6S33_008151 [Morchella sextelata]KAH0603147.1 hypothetical protein H6S33_008151 [Morchella sextelata]